MHLCLCLCICVCTYVHVCVCMWVCMHACMLQVPIIHGVIVLDDKGLIFTSYMQYWLLYV